MTGRTLIFTGDGKGKTTAALGMAFRAAGHGMRVLFVQFVKSSTDTGEIAAARQFPAIEIHTMGLGFVPVPEHPMYRDHREAAERAFDFAAERLGRYDLIVLDELCTAVSRGLIAESAAVTLMQQERSGCLVLTGRGATQAMIDAADTVTEMRCVKHGFAAGMAAQKGVEY